MGYLLLGCAIMIATGLASRIGNHSKMMPCVATAGIWIGCGLAFMPALATLTGHIPEPLELAWNMPGGALSLGMDALSMFFCLPVLIVSPLAALYGQSYFASDGKSQGSINFLYSILVSSMLLVMVARNGLLFLVIWETMAISSFFLVVTDHRQAHVRRAGLIYLIATHVGTVALLVYFAWSGQIAGSMDFDHIAATHLKPGIASILFVLAVMGFGTKAGFIPMHIWLPEAHPAAPSHVSALMSGVMIKTGIYGLLRVLLFLGPPHAAWGWALLSIGLVSGVLGVIFALVQHDLKRLLAYHSVENIGIITIGLGTGVLGLAWHIPVLIILGFGGGILHVLNHAIFKSLLFLGAGAVIHGTGTRNIEHLGGLLKNMRWTGVTFLIASAAISGLPPLNGFASEFLIYVAGIKGVQFRTPGTLALAVCILTGLALIGGLAAACFAKAFGIVFLGEPRTKAAAGAHEVTAAMLLPMLVLAGFCGAIAFFAPFVLKTVYPVVSMFYHSAGSPLAVNPNDIANMSHIVDMSLLLVAISAGLLILRYFLLRGKPVSETMTWDCGFARPESSMQYTASSFAQPLTDLFRIVLRTKMRHNSERLLFPDHSGFHSEAPDIVYEKMVSPTYHMLMRVASVFQRIQYGSIHIYLTYIAVTLIMLLVFKAGLPK